jgi:hypothetical protein
LTPGGRYYFQAENTVAKQDNGKTYSFRTLPSDEAPLRFLAGGDLGFFPWTKTLLREAATWNPQFAVLGGDLAYANGETRHENYWDAWLENWEKIMVTSDGDLIPMVLVIGNHEVNDLEGSPEVQAPFYFGYFPQGGLPYFSRSYGALMALHVLDSGHVVSWESQVPWLRDSLTTHQERPFQFTSYHVPFFPSHRDFEDERAAAGRTYWQPIFDEFGVEAAFENHDHTLKRTHRIRGDAIHDEGVLYLGDGAMGAKTRSIKNTDAWYLAYAEKVHHFWIVDVAPEGVQYSAVNVHGDIVDTHPEK